MPIESPSFPSYSEKECKRIMTEGGPLEQCELLLWLASKHPVYKKDIPRVTPPSDSLNGLPHFSSQKKVVQVRERDIPVSSVDVLREYVRETELLKILILSENLWVQQAAVMASEVLYDHNWKMQFQGQIPDKVLTPGRFSEDPFADGDPFKAPPGLVQSAQGIHR